MFFGRVSVPVPLSKVTTVSTAPEPNALPLPEDVVGTV